MRIYFLVTVLPLAVILLFIFSCGTTHGLATDYSGGGEPPFADDPTIMVKRSYTVSPGVGACPAGWTDGGTGSAYYSQNITYERYCY